MTSLEINLHLLVTFVPLGAAEDKMHRVEAAGMEEEVEVVAEEALVEEMAVVEMEKEAEIRQETEREKRRPEIRIGRVVTIEK
jgi:hypothetical protein